MTDMLLKTKSNNEWVVEAAATWIPSREGRRRKGSPAAEHIVIETRCRNLLRLLAVARNAVDLMGDP
jgi:hypothetical protein